MCVPMLYCCECGLEYSVTPKEIPSNDSAPAVCACGRNVRGRWGVQFFDYEPICVVQSSGARKAEDYRMRRDLN